MNRNLSALALALLVCFAGLFGAVGAVGAQSAGNDTLADRTLAVSEDTRALFVSAENASDVLDVTVHGIDDEDLSTEVDTAQLDATGNTTDSYEYGQVDHEQYPEYRVQVTGPENATAETLEVQKVQVIGGGGGLVGGTTGASMFVVLLLAAGGLVVFTQMRD